MKTWRLILPLVAHGFLGLFPDGAIASALTTTQFLYHVTIPTSPLTNHAAGPFSIQFTLIAGSGEGDANSQVLLTNFNFGTNGMAGEYAVNSGATGDLLSGVTLTDSGTASEFSQHFFAGDKLTFDATISLSVDTNHDSDIFLVALLDSTGVRLPTFDANFDNVLVRFSTPDGAALTVEKYRTDASAIPAAGGPPVTLFPRVLADGESPSTDRPVLNIRRSDEGLTKLHWPSIFGDFHLQESGDLLLWNFSLLPPAIAGDDYSVTLTPVDSGGLPAQFYRLVQ